MTSEDANPKESGPKSFSLVAGCLAGVVFSLVIVGIVSGTLSRHIIQIIPVVVAFILTIRGVEWSSSAALPIFFLWPVLMLLIWLFLAGIEGFINGHFTPIEIAMTIIIGICCLTGIILSLRSKESVKPAIKTVIFILFLGFQVVAMWKFF